jgi:hypothetical protein
MSDGPGNVRFGAGRAPSLRPARARPTPDAHERATSVVAGATDGNREQIRDAIEEHAEVIAGLRKQFA